MDNSHTALHDMLSAIVRALVEDPERATITVDSERGRMTCRIVVTEADIGTLIGKQGRTARTIRSLVAIYAAKVHQPISVDLKTL